LDLVEVMFRLSRPSATEDDPPPAPGAATLPESGTDTLPPPGVPTTVGRFRIRCVLGAGTFGTVYKAHDPELHRTVAIRVPRAGAFARAPEEERFLREARSTAQLRHPGIVPVHEIARAADLPCIVSDFIDGPTLADLLRDGRPDFARAAEVVARVADALD